MRRAALLLMVGTALLLSGCEVVSAVPPKLARERALTVPEVAAWFQAHAAPAVLESMPRQEALAYKRYVPNVIVDRVKEGLVVRLESRFGSEPRQVQVVVGREHGDVLAVKMVPK